MPEKKQSGKEKKFVGTYGTLHINHKKKEASHPCMLGHLELDRKQFEYLSKQFELYPKVRLKVAAWKNIGEWSEEVELTLMITVPLTSQSVPPSSDNDNLLNFIN